MNFVMHRNRTVTSTSGHAIAFVKGELTHVPPSMHDEVMAAGGVPEYELEEPEVDANVVLAPVEPTERKAALFVVFEKVALRAHRNDFTAGGTPHLKVLVKELGWPLETAERDAAWVEFNNKSK